MRTAGSSDLTRRFETTMKPTKGIEVTARQLKSGLWKARAKHVGPQGELLEVNRWARTEEAAKRAAHLDVLNGLRVFGRYGELVAREEGRFDI